MAPRVRRASPRAGGAEVPSPAAQQGRSHVDAEEELSQARHLSMTQTLQPTEHPPRDLSEATTNNAPRPEAATMVSATASTLQSCKRRWLT